MAAATVAKIAGVPQTRWCRQSSRSPGSNMRSSRWHGQRGVRFVNDSKATNVEAAQRAIESFDSGLVVIMGGRFKSGDFSLSPRSAARERGEGCGDWRSGCPHKGSARRRRAGRDRWKPGSGDTSERWSWLLRVERCCWRPRARASTCFAITPNAAMCSNARCAGWQRRSDAQAVNSRQSVAAVGNWLLGTQAAPACEAGVPSLRLTDDC